MKKGTTGFEPARMEQVLAARRLSQVQLAAMVGVSAPTISKWRNGVQAPEASALEKLAEVMNVAPEWFTRPLNKPLSKPRFRSMASAHASARQMLWARLEWLQDITLALEEFVDLPGVEVPTGSFRDVDAIAASDIEHLAHQCRDEWRLGSGPIPDVLLALENAGVIVVRELTGVATIEGASSWNAEGLRPFVLLAADKGNGFRSRFDAAHELGHLVLHKHLVGAVTPVIHTAMENQAHYFAGAFLLPAASFTSEVRLPVTLDNLLLLKQRWGVSVGAIIMRLHALGLVDDDEKMSLFKRRSARWGAKSEPGDDRRDPEFPRLLRRSIELVVESGVMGRGDLQRHLGLSRGDIEVLCGLREGYLHGNAEVLEMSRVKLRSNGTPSTGGPANTAQVLPFRKA